MKLKEKMAKMGQTIQAKAKPCWRKSKILIRRWHPRLKPYYPYVGSFLAGVLVTSLFFMGKSSKNPDSTDATATTTVEVAPDAIDWSPLADEMCRPDSEINRLAMRFVFPFERCMDNEGNIDQSCVEEDAAKLTPTLPEPFNQSLGAIQVKLDKGEGWTDMHYMIPLTKAAYHNMPLNTLAIRIETENRNELQGWQTPYLVIQDDFSKIKQALRQYSPAEQFVFYADIPPEKDILSGPFSTEEQAQNVTKKAGGKLDKITRQIMKAEATFNDKLNAVTVGCISQPIKKN